jgi:hypothetical protein
MGRVLAVQLAHPSELVHIVVLEMTRIIKSPATTAWRYGLVRSPAGDRQQSCQPGLPVMMRSRDPVRSQPPPSVECISTMASCWARSGPGKTSEVGRDD